MGNGRPTRLDQLLPLYSLMVEMADRVSQRRQAANNFYLTVNTVLIGATAYLSLPPAKAGVFALGLAGAAICALWIRNIKSYKTLNAAKFEVIHRLEEQMGVTPFKDEWALLDPDGDGRRHNPFHLIERNVPWVFIVVHLFQAASTFPYWGWVVDLASRISALCA